MKKEDSFRAYKELVQMRDLADKLDDALKKGDFDSAAQVKKQLIILQKEIGGII